VDPKKREGLGVHGHRTFVACRPEEYRAWLLVFPDMPSCWLKRPKVKLCSLSRCSVFITLRGTVHAVLGVPNKLTTGISRLREAHLTN
jgi:hypothetical protein